jgi:orotate phosphoribosyltransferase
MMKTNVISILKKVGAVLTDDHFVYTSGKHGSVYINKDAVYPHTKETSAICKLIARKFQHKQIEVVAAPALGGIILSQWTAHWLSRLTRREVLGIYTEKDAEKNQIFTRGYDRIVKGKRVLVVEDLTTTGGSVRKVVNAVKAAGGNVVSVCVMVNRDPKNVTAEVVDAPFFALGVLKAEAFDETQCPLCKKGIPVNTMVGHGKKFLSTKHGVAYMGKS